MITIKHKKLNIEYILSPNSIIPIIRQIAYHNGTGFNNDDISICLSKRGSYGATSSAISQLTSLLNNGFTIEDVALYEDIEDYELCSKCLYEEKRVIIEPILEWGIAYFWAIKTDFAKMPKDSSGICQIIHQSNLEGNIYGTKSIELMEELESVIIDVLERMHDTLI
jgi:hypothetical protein